MVRILAIGDFHGKFPAKLKGLVKKENVDLIVSVGDYMPFSYRKIWFKNCYRNDTELWEIIGKNKMKQLVNKDLKFGENILKQLNSLGKLVPVISITGNLDYTKWKDAIDYDKPKWAWPHQDFFSKIIKKYKNIKIFDYSSAKFNNLIFIGMATSTFPGRVKSKNYKKMRIKLDKLFKKFKKQNKNHQVIFVSHNVPYKTKMSKIASKNAPKDILGVEKGSKLVRRMIEKNKPVLHICGHMHEHQGKCKIGNTIVINPGAAVDGKAAIIDFDEEKSKVRKVEFIK